MKIISWNVNGIRAVVKKDFKEKFESLNADYFCLQETKAQDDQVAEALAEINNFQLSSNSAVKKGYSGTAILSKEKPISVQKGMGIEIHDHEGRILTNEFEHFFLVNVYVVNSSSGLKRLDYREQWDKDFLKYLKSLEETKPVIVLGDFNVCHQRIDIARPDSNYNKSPGYTQVEIDGMTNFLEAGFVDTFRALHPDEVAYSWWSYRAGAREKNIGWRLDYVLVSQSIFSKVKSSFILPNIDGSDHCPVGVEIDF